MKARRSALTLAEAALCIAVLAVAYLPLAELYRMTAAQTVKSRNALIAQSMAQTVFEVYKMRPNDLLYALSGDATPDLLTDTGWRERLTAKAREVEGVVKVAEMKLSVRVNPADPQVVGLDRVDLTFSWKEGGHEISRRFARLVAR